MASKRKNPTNYSDSTTSSEDDKKSVNLRIADFLYELATYEATVSQAKFKANAYRKAAAAIAKHDEEIRSGDQAKKMEGIGKQIALKIDEFLKTGKLQKLEKIRGDDTNVAIGLLTRVTGIGPVKARELVDQGVTTIEKLRDISDKLTKGQRIGLKHFEDFELRIPRAEIEVIESAVKGVVAGLSSKYAATVCGSYRRGLPSSGDVDFLLTHRDYTSEEKASAGGKLLKRVVEALEEESILTDTISKGDAKFMGVARAGKGHHHFRRIDIRILPADQFYCGVLYFTGSDLFNKAMRVRALEMGFTLNEYSIRPLDAGSVPLEPLPVSSEEDIFDYISYDYKPPSKRNI